MRKFLGGTAALGAALAAYSLYEPYRFRLVTRRVPARRGAPDLCIVHLSDTHVTGRDRARLRFIASLPERLGEVPDLVLVTGDMIEGDAGIDPLLDAVSGYEARGGIFYVLGSHDYFRSKFKIPTHYVIGGRSPVKAPPNDIRRLEEGFQKLGWSSLTNRTEIVKLAARAPSADAGPRRRGDAGRPRGGDAAGRVPESQRGVGDGGEEMVTIRVTGVDDPYLRWHRTDHIERRADEAFAIGLVHSPEVISDYVLNGFDLVLAGHTHAGQIRLPGLGALVTNSSLPAALAGGLHAVGTAWLHVSPGVGNSRFTPFRIGARPEITVLEVTPRA